MEKCNFQYKGDRKYVHGTDMFNYMVAMAQMKNVGEYNFTVNKMCINDCVCIASDESVPTEFVARLLMSKENEGSEKIWLVETDKKIDSAYDYDEDSVCEKSKVVNDTIGFIFDKSNYTFIEYLVANNKKLLSKLFGAIPGKWLFTRVDFEYDVTSTVKETVEIKFRKNLSNKLFKSEVRLDGNIIGNIYFSKVI